VRRPRGVYACPIVVLVDRRAGGFVLLGSVLTSLSGQRLFVLAMTVSRAVAATNAAILLTLLAGIAVAAGGERAGAAIALTGFGCQVAVDVFLGVRRYRYVLARPWPQVVPLAGDDDW
jgi:hypothetical protein